MERNKKQWQKILKGIREGDKVVLESDTGLPEEGEIVHIFERYPYVMVACGEEGKKPFVSLQHRKKIIEVKKE